MTMKKNSSGNTRTELKANHTKAEDILRGILFLSAFLIRSGKNPHGKCMFVSLLKQYKKLTNNYFIFVLFIVISNNLCYNKVSIRKSIHSHACDRRKTRIRTGKNRAEWMQKECHMNRFLKSSRQQRRVIVVDDELINRELLQTILALNYEVSVASNGMEALEMLHAEPNAFSLILLDIIMPQMSGFDVIKACKGDDKLKDIPIIVMTSEKSAEVRSIRMGAADFIAKPYRMPEVILARCERIIEQNEERELIRSIEKDPVTGLYEKLFFDAYLIRMSPNVRGSMDAVAIRVEGLDAMQDQRERDNALKKVAEMVKKNLPGTSGIACRTGDMIYSYCRHKENCCELFDEMQAKLDSDPSTEGITLKMGIYRNPDNSEPVNTWFEKAINAE